MVSAVHRITLYPDLLSFGASKGLHMVSAVHRLTRLRSRHLECASKGLHMVSAVHQVGLALRDRPSIRFKGAAHG